MPSMITQMTKNKDSEELCSCSTAWESMSGGSVATEDALPFLVVLPLPGAAVEGDKLPEGLLADTSGEA